MPETNPTGNPTQNKHLKHGHSAGGVTTRTYKSWSQMKHRCDNPNNKSYERYGGRGLTYCERWKYFTNFLEDMGEAPEGLEIERVDNELGYFKENCIWDTPANQNRNKSDSIKITINGVTKNQSVWCRENGVPVGTYVNRKRRGWDIKRALFEPPEKQLRLIAFNGETKHLSEWARHLGLTPMALWLRLKRMPIEKALTMPAQGVS